MRLSYTFYRNLLSTAACVTLTAEHFMALVMLTMVVLGQELGNKLDIDHGDLNFLRTSTMCRFVLNLDSVRTDLANRPNEPMIVT